MNYRVLLPFDKILVDVLSKKLIYSKVESSNTSRLEAHIDIFEMLMKGIFDPYVLLPFDHPHMGTPLPLRHADVLKGWSQI